MIGVLFLIKFDQKYKINYTYHIKIKQFLAILGIYKYTRIISKFILFIVFK